MNICTEMKESQNAESRHQFDFIYQTDDLLQIETIIKIIIQRNFKLKKLVCIGLAKIKVKLLYKQLEVKSFNEYLKMQRIPINYSTAFDYSVIGSILIEYHRELDAVNFTESDGLKKLISLHKALKNKNQPAEQLFQKMKQLSLREFERYIKSYLIKKTETKSQQTQKQQFKIRLDDETIFFASDNLEIIWFNMDLESKLGIPNLYKNLQKHLLGSLQEFFDEQLYT